MVGLAMMLLSFGVIFRSGGIERSRRLGRGFFGDGLPWEGFLLESGPFEIPYREDRVDTYHLGNGRLSGGLLRRGLRAVSFSLGWHCHISPKEAA